MAEETKKVEAESTPVVVEEPKKDVSDEKPEKAAPAPKEKPADVSKAVVISEKAPDTIVKKNSHDRDVALAEVEKEKKASFIKAWEDSEKAKAENKAQKKLAVTTAWENSKKASKESELKKIEEELEKKKAAYAEKMKNKVALLHKLAEEKRAEIEAQRAQELLKAEETAAKYRATGIIPKKFLGCF